MGPLTLHKLEWSAGRGNLQKDKESTQRRSLHSLFTLLAFMGENRTGVVHTHYMLCSTTHALKHLLLFLTVLGCDAYLIWLLATWRKAHTLGHTYSRLHCPQSHRSSRLSYISQTYSSAGWGHSLVECVRQKLRSEGDCSCTSVQATIFQGKEPYRLVHTKCILCCTQVVSVYFSCSHWLLQFLVIGCQH